jgi:hypothetical protein
MRSEEVTATGGSRLDAAKNSHLGTASLLLPHRIEAIHLPSIFNLQVYESPSFRVTANIHSPAALAKTPGVLSSTQLDALGSSLAKLYSASIQSLGEKENTTVCSTELHCHSPAQHHGEMNVIYVLTDNGRFHLH